MGKTNCKNRWILRELIRDCNYGMVWKGYDALTSKAVAIKQCSKKLINGKKEGRSAPADNVEDEIKYQEMLNGPVSRNEGRRPENILEIYESYDDHVRGGDYDKHPAVCIAM